MPCACPERLTYSFRDSVVGAVPCACPYGDDHGKYRVKVISANGGCLGSKRRRKTWQPAKSPGELATSIDPRISEWGNPVGEILLSQTEYIGLEKRTQGTETSQYLEEKKSTEISLVAASEREPACNVESIKCLLEWFGKASRRG